jgi:hypothetical protein
MPEHSEEDYKLASSRMSGIWSRDLKRITTGICFYERCACGEFVTGVEYEPQLTESLVRDVLIVWYGRTPCGA